MHQQRLSGANHIARLTQQRRFYPMNDNRKLSAKKSIFSRDLKIIWTLAALTSCLFLLSLIAGCKQTSVVCDRDFCASSAQELAEIRHIEKEKITLKQGNFDDAI